MQQLQPFRCHPLVRLCDARHVAAWTVKAGDEAELHRVAAHFEDDRNGRGCSFGCERGRGAARGNDRYLTAHQIGRHRWQAIVLLFRPTVFDRHVAAIDVTGFAQPFEKGR